MRGGVQGAGCSGGVRGGMGVRLGAGAQVGVRVKMGGRFHGFSGIFMNYFDGDYYYYYLFEFKASMQVSCSNRLD